MEDLRLLKSNMALSFLGVKKDFSGMGDAMRHQSSIIRQLFENQKLLLMRVRQLEGMRSGKNERFMEKRIILSAKKTAHKAQYVGSAGSMKLHDSICPFAKNVKPKNRIIFKSKSKAFNKGYRPCNCLKKV